MEELTDYSLELQLPAEPELRSLVESARCEAYVKQMHLFIGSNQDLVLEKTLAGKRSNVYRISNAHFANCLDKGLHGLGIQTQARCLT